MKNTAHLTDTEVRRTLAPKQGQRFVWDEEVKGFALRVTFTGAKAFVLDYRAEGRQRRITIGSFPDWSVAAARKAAGDMKQDVDRGHDPLRDRKEDKAAPTLQDLWARYRDEWLPKKAPLSQKDETSAWENIILPKLGKEKLKNIKAADIDDLHSEITNIRKTPIRANRIVAFLRKAFNLAIRWQWLDRNPVMGIKVNPEDRRTRYLNKKEIAALMLALNQHADRTAANAIKLLMLTGARKSEVTGATWDMFDLENGIWTKPSAHTKQRKLHRVPLSSPAQSLLIEIKQQAGAAVHEARRAGEPARLSPYVFPSDISPDHPIQEIRCTWITVCKAAGLTEKIQKKDRQGKPMKDENGNIIMIDWPNVRVHDLRHSFASILVSAGASLPLIGQMLGHTQVQTTQRYAHLYDDPLRKAAEMVGDVMVPLPKAKAVAKMEQKILKKASNM